MLIKKLINFAKANLFYIFSFVFFFLLNIFIYRSLLFNFATNLLDWNDYPLYVWIMQHNIDHFRSLSLTHFFDTNIFYPFKGNLLFSDLFLPTSIIGLILSFFTNNQIIIFNITFFIVLFLNPIACFFFWKNFFSSKWVLFFATLTSAFSPFIILNSYHFQMLNIWPFFFSLGFLLRNKLILRDLVLGGVFLALQFWTGIYYAIFALFIIFIWYFLKFWEIKKSKQSVIVFLKKLSIFIAVLSVLSGFLIFKYMQTKNEYGMNREYWEYVIYAANPTDYLFMPYHSLFSEAYPIKHWNSFSVHNSGVAFPGFVLFGLVILGIFNWKKTNQGGSVVLFLEKERIVFLLLIVFGFIFSLGARLSVNGVYTGIPMPYALALKLIPPFFEPIRADARWVVLFYIGLTYFACYGLNKILYLFRRETVVVMILIIFYYIVEVIPIIRSTEAKDYHASIYKSFESLCQINSTVLLEYPLTQDKKDANIVSNLSYKTQMLMASMYHKCNIVNGYSGYIPKDYERYENELYGIVSEGDKENFYRLLKQRDVDIFKLNKKEIYSAKAEIIELWLNDKERYRILVNNNEYTIAKLL